MTVLGTSNGFTDLARAARIHCLGTCCDVLGPTQSSRMTVNLFHFILSSATTSFFACKSALRLCFRQSWLTHHLLLCIMLAVYDYDDCKSCDALVRYRINEGGTVWEYELVHVSRDITPKEAADEALVLQEMYQRHAELCANRVGTSFRTLPDDLCDDTVWHVFGEVVSAHHFEYNNLYARLQLDLPPGWILDASSARAFVTQVSRTSSTGDSDDTAMFSYPFELAVRSPARQDDGTDNSGDASTRSPSLSPKLIVQVNSLDELERHRPEGWGVPTAHSAEDVHCCSS